MLLKCPECELQVSDKAASCPHCGYPMKENIKPRTPRKSNKKRRLPNGFGQISEIKNRNLRNPFRAMVTVGKNEFGRPICKPLKPESYFETYNDAYAALAEYNKNPYDLAPSMTVKELYEKWSEEYFKTLNSESSVRLTKNAWGYCGAIYNMRVVDLRARHIKGCMDEGEQNIYGKTKKAGANAKKMMKTLFNLMLDYALEYELVERNYARDFKLSADIKKSISTVQKSHRPFTDEEMALLWKNVGSKKYVDVLLIQCYSGWRPQELGLLELKNVDLENWTFTGGIKTESGMNRVVPIHSKIRKFVAEKYAAAQESGSKYLFSCDEDAYKKRNRKLTYDRYKNYFNRIRDELKLNPEHRPHDGRTHFVTTAKKYGVDEYAIKYMVGHKISDLTEKVYTKREFEWLQTEIEKIK